MRFLARYVMNMGTGLAVGGIVGGFTGYQTIGPSTFVTISMLITIPIILWLNAVQERIDDEA